jgi:hypothetical protein
MEVLRLEPEILHARRIVAAAVRIDHENYSFPEHISQYAFVVHDLNIVMVMNIDLQ